MRGRNTKLWEEKQRTRGRGKRGRDVGRETELREVEGCEREKRERVKRGRGI